MNTSDKTTSVAEMRIYQVPERLKNLIRIRSFAEGKTLNAMCIELFEKAMEGWELDQGKKGGKAGKS